MLAFYLAIYASLLPAVPTIVISLQVMHCITCKERNIVKVYEGETERSARTRGAEHLKELEKEKEKSVLFKHKMSDHKNENVKLKN